jgi:cell division protein FtsQ
MADHALFLDRPFAAGKNRANPAPAILAGLLLLIIVCEGCFHFFIAPNLVIGNITISGDASVVRSEVLRAAGLTGKVGYFSVDAPAIEQALKAWPAFRDAKVEKVFPDTVRIRVLGRKPVAIAFTDLAGSPVPLAFDSEGVIFQQAEGISDWSLPVISGLRFEGETMGARLPASIVAFLGKLNKIRESSPAVFNYFSEFKIQKKDADSIDVIAYPVSRNVPIRIGGDLDLDQARLIIMVLDVMQKERILDRVEELDFRTGEIVYRLKGSVARL